MVWCVQLKVDVASEVFTMLARLAALALATFTVTGVVAGCAADTTDDASSDATGDTGDSASEQDLISEHQLTGSELPAKTVALTFDDGPGDRTIELTDYLASQGVPATFFINGMRVPGRQASVDAVVNRGFILGNHTQNHLQLTKLTSAKVVTEVTQTDNILVAAQPNGPFILRAPFGAMNGSVVRAINATPMKKYSGSVFWDIGGELTATSAADWDCWGKGVAIETCGKLYMQEIRKRGHGVILMHDIHNKTIDMVKKVIVPTLKAEGYSFAKLTDVPAVKRSLASVDQPAPAATACSSATLGRNVEAGSCVQARSDSRWNVCANGEWNVVTGPADAKCTGQKFPLQ